ELANLCVEQQIGVITYSSLASGFLSGKYRQGADMPRTPRAASVQQRYWNSKNFALLERLDQVASQYNATPAQIALVWLLMRPGVTAPIASATSVAQTRELMGAFNIELDQAAFTALE
ncbi:MAG TPA: aldo/keto reductase, partial [Ktedonobacteraceae bacterium]|nr:aldo/keto reductase [Ktedonobacteraceae bacterium]